MGRINPIRYRGYYYDEETGLYYLQSRYYDPVVGRFLNADEYTDDGAGVIGHNLFTYCGNNPILNQDSNGRFLLTSILIAAGVSAVVSMAADVVSQAIQGHGFENYDIRKTLVSGLAGAVSGACSMIPVIGVVGSIAINSALGVGTYATNQTLDGEKITVEGLVSNAIIGGIGGYVGCKVRSAPTQSIQSQAQRSIAKGMNKISTGVKGAVKRGKTYLSTGYKQYYQYGAKVGLNSGIGSVASAASGLIYNKFMGGWGKYISLGGSGQMWVPA